MTNEDRLTALEQKVEALQGRMNEHIALHPPFHGDNKPEPAQPAAAGYWEWSEREGVATSGWDWELSRKAWMASAVAERERIARIVVRMKELADSRAPLDEQISIDELLERIRSAP